MTRYFLKVPQSAQARGGGGGGGARMIWVMAGDRSGLETAGPLYHNSAPCRAGDEPRTPHRGADISGLNPTTDTHSSYKQPTTACRERKLWRGIYRGGGIWGTIKNSITINISRKFRGNMGGGGGNY